jgi:hypothetical protein
LSKRHSSFYCVYDVRILWCMCSRAVLYYAEKNCWNSRMIAYSSFVQYKKKSCTKLGYCCKFLNIRLKRWSIVKHFAEIIVVAFEIRSNFCALIIITYLRYMRSFLLVRLLFFMIDHLFWWLFDDLQQHLNLHGLLWFFVHDSFSWWTNVIKVIFSKFQHFFCTLDSPNMQVGWPEL